MASGLRDSVEKGQITGSLPDIDIPCENVRLLELQAAIVATLGMADALKLSMVGIHLDQARVELAFELERHRLHDDVLTMSPPGTG